MHKLEWDRTFALEQAGDEEEMLAELLLLFRDTSVGDLARMREALAAADAAALAEAAHSVKGAAASLGIEGMRRLAAAIEQCGKRGDLAGSAGLVAELTELMPEVAALR